MAFLTINNIEVKLVSATQEPVRIGERSRAFSGKARKSVRAQKREWSAQTGPLEPVLATALSGLIDGDGHHFPFDSDLYSERGLGPLAGHGGTPTASPGKFGAGYLTLGASSSITYPAQLATTWTVAMYRRESGAWAHYVVNSAGQKWRNGSRNDSLTSTWLTVSSGDVTLTNTGAAEFDDLVVLPYVTPTDWPTIWASSASAFSALPYLRAEGDMTGSLTVMGEVGQGTSVSFSSSSSFVNGLQLNFSLFEV